MVFVLISTVPRGWLNKVKQIRNDFWLNTCKHDFLKLGTTVKQIRNKVKHNKCLHNVYGKHENGVNFWALSYKHRNGHENNPRESCGPLDRTVPTGILVRTFL